LPIEFSRISKRRFGALTLVIDPRNGCQIVTRFCFSKRRDPEDVACDLRQREGTTIRNIGITNLDTGNERSRYPFVAEVVKAWAQARSVRAVVWTDLEPYFEKKTEKPFSPEVAADYLRGLGPEGIREAIRYIRNAPAEVDTKLRRLLARDTWFQQRVVESSG